MVILPDWIGALPLQQQAVLVMALRGPDGFPKDHRSKPILYFYRGCILKAANSGRMLHPKERCATFMSMDGMEEGAKLYWNDALANFKSVEDELPLHYYTHLMHGAQVLAYKHPDQHIRARWFQFYYSCCDYLHVPMETTFEMEKRLDDFGRRLEEVIDA